MDLDLDNEAAHETVKTSVSLLQEICMGLKLGFPMFNLSKVINNPSVGPTDRFEMTVTVISLGLEASGVGRTKMLAKHKAADRLMTLIMEAGDKGLDLNNVSHEIVLQCCEKMKLAVRLEEDASLEFNMSSGKLKQFCMAREITPLYEIMEVTGPGHNRKYVMSCKVLDHITQGEGKSKKVAKTIAAEKMLLLVDP